MNTPRSFLRLMFQRFSGSLACVLLLGATIFASLALYEGRRADRLENHGAGSVATMTKFTYNNSRRSKENYIYFWFITDDGQRVETRQRVTPSFYETMRQQVQRRRYQTPVRYWPDDPTLAEVESGRAAWAAVFSERAFVWLLVLSIVFGFLGWRAAKSATWLRDHGTRRQVTVLAHVYAINFVGYARLRKATWCEENGRKGATLPARANELPPVGSEITIFVDPHSRRKSIWLGDLIK